MRRHTRLSCDWSSDVCSSDRSEEHTSELQHTIISYAVFCLSSDVCSSDRKSTRLNSSHTINSYAVFCLQKKWSTVSAPCSTSSMNCFLSSPSIGYIKTKSSAMMELSVGLFLSKRASTESSFISRNSSLPS